MTVTETRHQSGGWSLQLGPDTPTDIIDLFNTEGPGGFGTLIVTDSYRSGVDLDPATLPAVARWSGIYRKRTLTRDDQQRATWTIEGPGLLAFLGDLGGDDEQGSYVFMDQTGGSDDHRCDTWAGLIIEGGLVEPARTWLPSALMLRANIAPAANNLYTYGITAAADARYLSRRSLLDWLTVRYPGVEYRIHPDATISVGPRGSIYDDSIRPLVARTSGHDPGFPGIPGRLGGTEDIEDYAYRIYLHRGSGLYAITNFTDTRYRDPYGRTLLVGRHVDADIPDGWADVYADALYVRGLEPRRTVTVEPEADDVNGQLICGGFLNVYDPEQGILNLANGMMHRGAWVYPTAVRLESYTWPVTTGMGVYFRWWTSSTVVRVVDLTPYIVPETSGVSLEVGSPFRGLRRR